MTKREFNLCLLAIVTFALAFGTLVYQRHFAPRLRGYGCEGVPFGKVIYRRHEDQFPNCAVIEEIS